jgi:hypothetical protein
VEDDHEKDGNAAQPLEAGAVSETESRCALLGRPRVSVRYVHRRGDRNDRLRPPWSRVCDSG